MALIEGVVNAYNGKLVLIDQDIEIQGQDPLEMTRYYDGGHHFSSEFGYGIGCTYPALLRFITDRDKSYVSLELRQGSEVLFEVKNDKREGKNAMTGGVSKVFFKSGYTNCCEALLRGEPSIYVMKVISYPYSAVVDMGNGTKRHYKHYKILNNGSAYILYLEEKGNGNRCHYSYSYNGQFQLKRISTLNCDESLTLNWLNFENDGNHTVVRGSNGQEAHYLKKVETGKVQSGNTKSRPNELVLKEATVKHYPTVQYEVLKNTHSLNTVFSVSKVKKSNGQFLLAEYDSHERVKKLFTAGNDNPFIPLIITLVIQ